MNKIVFKKVVRIKKNDEIELWNKIWDRIDNGENPLYDFTFDDILDELDIPEKRGEYILDKWFGNDLINCGIRNGLGWIEEGIKREDLMK